MTAWLHSNYSVVHDCDIHQALDPTSLCNNFPLGPVPSNSIRGYGFANHPMLWVHHLHIDAVSPYSILLGQGYSRRPLRSICARGHRDGGHQHGNGHFDYSSTCAYHLEATDELSAKSCRQLRVQSRSIASILIPRYASVLITVRVCLVTVVRLVLLATTDYENGETTPWLVIGIFTTMEFYLGIITACLPLLPPVGSHIAKTFRESRLQDAFLWSFTSLRQLWSSRSSEGSLSRPKSGDKLVQGDRWHAPYGPYTPLQVPHLENPDSNASLATQNPHPVSDPIQPGKGIVKTSGYFVESS